MRSGHSWTQQISLAVKTQQRGNKGPQHPHPSIHPSIIYPSSIHFHLTFLPWPPSGTVGASAGQRAVRLPVAAAGAFLRHSGRLPPLLLLSGTQPLAPLASSAARLSLHLMLIRWLVSTKISSSLLHFVLTFRERERERTSSCSFCYSI